MMHFEGENNVETNIRENVWLTKCQTNIHWRDY